MKFNLKAITAAVALVASAGSAFAAIDNNLTAAPGADVAFMAYDFGAGIGYMMDTNIKFSQLDAKAFFFTADLSSNSAFNSFKAASAANGASTGIQWTVFSANNNTAVGAKGALLGKDVSLGVTTPTLTLPSLNTIDGSFNTVVAPFNVAGSSDAGNFLQNAQIGSSIGAAGTFATRTSWNVTEQYTAGVAATENLFRYTLLTTSPGALVGTATLDSAGVLTVAAVPEPGTYALMLAGLLTLGAVARRRSRG